MRDDGENEDQSEDSNEGGVTHALRLCQQDTISGKSFQTSFTAVLGGKKYRGCGSRQVLYLGEINDSQRAA